MLDNSAHILKAAIYIRVSTPEQADGNSPEGQIHTIKKYIAARNNLEFAGDRYIYQDLAVSGADPIESRVGLGKLIDDIRYSTHRPFDVILVYKIDRFARKLNILLEIINELDSLNIGFISTQESIDTNSAFGKAMLGILGVFSELERDMILERTKMGINEGLNSGSRYKTRKYGYQKNNDTGHVTVIEEEANVVKRIFEMLVYEQQSIKNICSYLEDSKTPNPSTAMQHYGGKQNKRGPYSWADKTVRQLLRNEIYIGKYYYNKERRQYIDKAKNKFKSIKVSREQWTLSPIQHEPIIPNDLFEKAQTILDSRTRGSRSTEKYLLSGLLKCDCCKQGKNVDRVSWVGHSSHGVTTYRCRGRDKTRYDYICPTTSIKADALEELVIEEIKRLINDPEGIHRAINKQENIGAHKQMIQREMKLVENRLTDIQRKKGNNKELRQDGDISRSEFQERLEKLAQAEKTQLDNQTTLQKIYKQQLNIDAQQKALQIINSHNIDLNPIFTDRRKCQRLLNLLIEEIIVFSDVDNDLILPGRNKEGDRSIPHTIMIKFRLPQDFLNEFYGERNNKNPNSPNRHGSGEIRFWGSSQQNTPKGSTKKDKKNTNKQVSAIDDIVYQQQNSPYWQVQHKLNDTPIRNRTSEKKLESLYIRNNLRIEIGLPVKNHDSQFKAK